MVDQPCTVSHNNYLRSNFDEECAWEPVVEMLDPTEIQKFEKL